MAEQTTIARPYARAAFMLAREKEAVEQWEQALSVTAEAASDPNVRAFLERPELGAAEKVDGLSAVYEQAAGHSLGELPRGFLMEMAEKKRLHLLAEVNRIFHGLVAEYRNFTDVELVSAFELDDSQTESLASALKRRIGQDVHLSTSVDARLIGGAIIRAGDTVIDSSLRGRLNRLAEQLNS